MPYRQMVMEESRHSRMSHQALSGRNLFGVLVLWSWLALAPPGVRAIPVQANIKGVVQTIGNVTASNGFSFNDPTTNDLGETGRFLLDPTYRYLMDDSCGYQFRWFQIGTTDTAPLDYKKAPIPVPYVDPPNGGYDTQRQGGDDLPFYETDKEYAFDSQTHDVGHNATIGDSRTDDSPRVPAPADANTPGELQFQTYITFVNPDLLAKKQFYVLAGYSWGGTRTTTAFTFNGPDAVDPANNLDTMKTAIKNSGFDGWTPVLNYNIPDPCPEPCTSLLLLAGLGVSAARIRKQS